MRVILGVVVAALASCEQVGDLGTHVAGTAAGGDGGGSGVQEVGEDAGGAAAGAEAGGGEGGGSCTPESCPEPAPGAPNYACPDGTEAGPACVADGEGGCVWELVECPPFDCTEAECGPAPPDPNMLCEDGVTLGGPGPCQQLDDGTCGYPWIACPEGGCCDAGSEPDCPTPQCCSTGMWSCDPCPTAGEVCETCVAEMGSCAAGETCCTDLQCCSGVPVPPGEEFCGMVCPISDRNRKENLVAVDSQAILEKVGQLQISTWNYTFEPDAIRHVGPMAQDFKAAFDVGASDRSIFTVDADGVALAAIQALREENKALRATVSALEARINKLEDAARPHG